MSDSGTAAAEMLRALADAARLSVDFEHLAFVLWLTALTLTTLLEMRPRGVQ